MQELQFSGETTFDGAKHSQRKMNECSHIGRYADKQENNQSSKIENKVENFQDNKNENKQNFNQGDLGLSSVLGLFTPKTNNQQEEQPVKKKIKKKSKRGFRR